MIPIKEKKECQCCGAVYSLSYQPSYGRDLLQDPDDEDSVWEDDRDAPSDDFVPRFCPFCGADEDDEPIEEDV